LFPQLESAIGPEDQVQFVLDGGTLQHHISWSIVMAWDELCLLYMQYVVSIYGKYVVVFDGYSNAPCTKDCTHLRRSGGGALVAVHFTGAVTLKMKKKDEFLFNKENKQRFMHLLSGKLEVGVRCIRHVKMQIYVLIVKTDVGCANKQVTVLIGDYAALLVLLCFHVKDTQ
jgi:hypothetical protein